MYFDLFFFCDSEFDMKSCFCTIKMCRKQIKEQFEQVVYLIKPHIFYIFLEIGLTDL